MSQPTNSSKFAKAADLVQWFQQHHIFFNSDISPDRSTVYTYSHHADQLLRLKFSTVGNTADIYHIGGYDVVTINISQLNVTDSREKFDRQLVKLLNQN